MGRIRCRNLCKLFNQENGGPSDSDGGCQVAGGNAPPILFLFLTKRERAAPGPREKNAAAGRSAQSAYLQPPAGEGWPCLAAALMKRDALGESSGPGRVRIPPASLSAGAALAVNAGRRGRRPLQDGACRGGCPHPPALPDFHQLPSKAQANQEGQTFRHPPRGFCPIPTRGGRATQMPKSGASR